MTGNIRKYIPSDWNVTCQVCGRKRKRSECVMAYGSGDLPVVMSCMDGCADYRHPLNSPPPVILDGMPVPDARPDQTEINNETFVSQNYPSFMVWGNFKPGGNWGALNLGNKDTNLNPVWTWGNFRAS